MFAVGGSAKWCIQVQFEGTESLHFNQSAGMGTKNPLGVVYSSLIKEMSHDKDQPMIPRRSTTAAHQFPQGTMGQMRRTKSRIIFQSHKNNGDAVVLI